MPRQHEFFRQELELRPPRDTFGPRLWVRRLVIWKEPAGEIIRNIALRPGLNIVWTPDDQGIGHGGGKTLFCRLLRYCLGEDRYAPEDQRSRIGEVFPNGLVGAEVMLDGACWAVIRPLGSRRRHLAIPDGNLDELAAGEAASTGIEPFLDAVEQAILTEELANLVPGHRQERRIWPIALAWLVRDQECRFDHVLDWRSTTSDSDSPARGLNQTEKLDALRAFLQAITPEEPAKRVEIARLDEEKRGIEQKIGHRRWEIRRIKTRLLADLEIPEDVLRSTLRGRNTKQPAPRWWRSTARSGFLKQTSRTSKGLSPKSMESIPACPMPCRRPKAFHAPSAKSPLIESWLANVSSRTSSRMWKLPTTVGKKPAGATRRNQAP